MGVEPPDIGRIFLREAFDQIDGLASLLLEAERTGDSAVVTSLLRVAHNLKGASATVGLAELADFVHLFESLWTGCAGSVSWRRPRSTTASSGQAYSLRGGTAGGAPVAPGGN